LVHYSNSLFINKYAQIALIATDYISKGVYPSEAWEKASNEIFENGSSSQKKGCPKNGNYAIRALEYLKRNNNGNIKVSELWEIATQGETKKHNS